MTKIKVWVKVKVREILLKVYPELEILLRKNVDWSFASSSIIKSNLAKSVKLYTPHHIVNTNIGKYTYIAQNAYISYTVIGKFCSIGPNFLCGWGIHPTNGVSTHPMFYSTLKQNGVTFSQADKIQERKEISIGNDVFIGANVTILDGVTIGNGVMIGAGAVVSKDIPDYAIAVGSPIKIVKYRFESYIIDELLKIKWWDWPENKLEIVEKMEFDILNFIKNKGK